jgi:hypothetical protein
LATLAGPTYAIDIVFDYTYDTNNYFGGANVSRRSLLDQAATTFEGFTDNLTAITSGGSNNFTARPFNPSGGADLELTNFSVPANVVTVFAGAQTFSGNTLAIGGPGGFGVSGTQAFVDNAFSRGQPGALANPETDFARFGGTISFDLDSNFFYGSTTAGLNNTQADFLSVAIHELAHLLGFGTSESFTTDTSGSNFIGPNATNVFGGPVPLDGVGAAAGHWAPGTSSFVGATPQEAAMDPTLTSGTRKLFTTLDYAGMADIGWQTAVPEPAGLAVLGLAAAGALRRRRA